MEKLAIHGGPKLKKTPFAQGRRFGDAEINELTEILQGNTLFYRYGDKTAKMERRMKELYGVEYAIACSSGSASIHCAVAALGIGPGDEVLVPSVTDMGSVIGILYQGAIPVFLDMDMITESFNFDLNDIEGKITGRTKALLVVHHMGNPCDMDKIMEIAERRNLFVIEDCAQSWHARHKGKLVGTMGDVGCFSLNDFKLISTGEGGLCVTNNELLAERIRLYTDKCYYRDGSGRMGDFLAPNYRISELCSAVGYAQMGKLEWITQSRNRMARKIDETVTGIKGLYPMRVGEGSFCSYWFYLVRIDEDEFGISRDDFVEIMNAEGVPCGGSHTPTPLYDYNVFKILNAFEGTQYPFKSKDFASDYSYENPNCPNSQPFLDKTIIITLDEFYSEEDVADICAVFTKIAENVK